VGIVTIEKAVMKAISLRQNSHHNTGGEVGGRGGGSYLLGVKFRRGSCMNFADATKGAPSGKKKRPRLVWKHFLLGE